MLTYLSMITDAATLTELQRHAITKFNVMIAELSMTVGGYPLLSYVLEGGDTPLNFSQGLKYGELMANSNII